MLSAPATKNNNNNDNNNKKRGWKETLEGNESIYGLDGGNGFTVSVYYLQTHQAVYIQYV